MARRSRSKITLISKDNKSLLRVARMETDAGSLPVHDEQNWISTGSRCRGNKDAKVTIVNYDDFECPFCARMHETLTDDILKTYGDGVQDYLQGLPVSGNPSVGRACGQQCRTAWQLRATTSIGDFADYMHANQHQISSQTKSLAEQEANIDRITLDQAAKAKIPTAPVRLASRRNGTSSSRRRSMKPINSASAQRRLCSSMGTKSMAPCRPKSCMLLSTMLYAMPDPIRSQLRIKSGKTRFRVRGHTPAREERIEL